MTERKPDFVGMAVFEPEVRKIEIEIIEYFSNSIFGSARSDITTRILFYFITRKYLTQASLQRLTGYSAGKISQEVNDFLKMGLITIFNKSSKGTITYAMESISSEIFSRSKNIMAANMKWEPKFSEIKREMEENRESLQEFNGYDKVLSFVEENLARFAQYNQVLTTWDEVESKIKKK